MALRVIAQCRARQGPPTPTISRGYRSWSRGRNAEGLGHRGPEHAARSSRGSRDGPCRARRKRRPLSCSNQQAFLLENVPCNNASCEGAHRMLKVYWELAGLSQIRDAVVAAFFDIYEDVSSEAACASGSDRGPPRLPSSLPCLTGKCR